MQFLFCNRRFLYLDDGILHLATLFLLYQNRCFWEGVLSSSNEIFLEKQLGNSTVVCVIPCIAVVLEPLKDGEGRGVLSLSVAVVDGKGGCTQFGHGRSRMAIDLRIPTMPGRSTSGFHQPGKHCVQRGAVRRGGGEGGGRTHLLFALVV